MFRITTLVVLGCFIFVSVGSVEAGNKRESSVQDIPVSVSAISEDQLESIGTRDVTDLLKDLPHVTPSQAGNCSNTKFANLRGVAPINVGANNEFGTGAQFQDQVQGAATGMASKALGSVLGGSGISLGGGGNNGSSDGPKIYKDPTSGSFTRSEYNDFELGTRAVFLGDTLTVSQQVLDSPGGDSTFHSTWLENSKGQIIMPKRYYIYKLYTDHKLSFWWKYDRYVNGQHVEHREGDGAFAWRTYDGLQIVDMFEGKEGVENSIWHQSGFDTAVKGIKVIGAEYDLSPQDLAGSCPLTLNTHLTAPGLDPVMTQPMINALYVDPAQAEGKAFEDIKVGVNPYDMNKWGLNYSQYGQ